MATTNKEWEMRVGVDRIVGFAKQFDEAHLNLACHAAFPLVLTPDLLYQIWAHFVPKAPWTAVARVLLSRLCRQVGYEMYEMDIAVRNLLLKELKEHFGQGRFDELDAFLTDYVAQRLTGDDPDTQDLAQAQEWTALAYTKPDEVARELAEALSVVVNQEDMGEVFHLASLVETLADPLVEAGFEPLLVYSRGMKSFVRDDLEGAKIDFGKLPTVRGQLKIAGVNLDIPLYKPKPLIDDLVQQVRQKLHDRIQYQCGFMRMLDISEPFALADIYTDVNILEQINSQRLQDISELLQDFNPQSDEFDRLGLSRVRQKRVPGLEAVLRYSKLMVLGKPGSGKTTLLKYVAMQCNNGYLLADRVPIFIQLKNSAEDTRDKGNWSLLHYISEQFVSCGVTDQSVAETLLLEGKGLILLDGLDEVPEKESQSTASQMRHFCQEYDSNYFLITCRIAAYQYRFEGFTEVEIADFGVEQVAAFARKWFVAVAKNNQKEGLFKANQFLDKLNQPENQPIKELAVTPIFLNLICLVFQAKGEFPSKRSKLYEIGLEILLKRWDEARGIQRDTFYRNLSSKQKIDLLSQLATIAFEQGYYFFEETKAQEIIANCLGISLEDSKAVLKSIEAQHGLLVERAKSIYSFSHLTFQEYFAARCIVERSGSESLENITSSIDDGRWREVFSLATEMVANAER